jgi:hypothetical protein
LQHFQARAQCCYLILCFIFLPSSSGITFSLSKKKNATVILETSAHNPIF